MNREIFARLAFAVVLLASAVATLALDCGTSGNHIVTVTNDTAVAVNVRMVDHSGLTTSFRLAPGKTSKRGMARSEFPDTVSAVDETGIVRFEATVTWDEVKMGGWQISIH